MATNQAFPDSTMTGGPDLARRLDRLRQTRRGGAFESARAGASATDPAASGPDATAGTRTLPGARPFGAGGSPGAAERLATALGGTVEYGTSGRIVRVRAAVDLPLRPERLATLPFPIDPSKPLLCLDTETTGLGTAAGTLAFMVGLGRWDGARFVVEQLVLPDHSDEPALLAALRLAIPPDAWLVTYNGRGFDWPLLVTRYRLHGRPAPAHAGHLDLLPVARLLWRHRLENARLSSVEAGVVGVRRHEDLPGALVPARYFAFLATGDAGGLEAVAEHNRLDVISLARLVAHLADRLADPESLSSEPWGDVAALGRAYRRVGRHGEALRCAAAAMRPALDRRRREDLLAERARLLRLLGRRDEALAAWLELAGSGGSQAAVAWVHVAKHHEHVRHDPAAALLATQQAASILERDRLLGRRLPSLERDLAIRRRRLSRRLAGGPRVYSPSSPRQARSPRHGR